MRGRCISAENRCYNTVVNGISTGVQITVGHGNNRVWHRKIRQLRLLQQFAMGLCSLDEPCGDDGGGSDAAQFELRAVVETPRRA